MKLVERFVVKKRYYDEYYNCKLETACIATTNVLLESDDLLELGSYLNDELRLDYDCNRLLKDRATLEESGNTVVYSKQLSDAIPLHNSEEYYAFNKEYLIEK